MDLLISLCDTKDTTTGKCLLKHDLYGNIIILYGNDVYSIYMDSDIPVLFKIKISKLKKTIKYNVNYGTGKLHVTPGSTTLRSLVTDKLEKNGENEVKDYFPERMYFHYQLDKIKIRREDEPVRVFYGFDAKYVNKMCYDVHSSYDFLFVDGNTKSKKFTLLSESYNDVNPYRLTIYTSGVINCNIIGGSNVTYRVTLKNDNLELQFRN